MIIRRLALTAVLSVIPFVVLLHGCETLKSSKPIVMQREYEQMIVGRLDADYVGNDTCLSACHFHDRIRKDFEASTMGAQMSGTTGLPLIDCESCHGPGSLAIEGITAERVKADAEKGIRTECRHETLIDLKSLPSPALSLICLKCHSANATFNLHNWNAGAHALAEISCSNCHDVHAGPDLIVRHDLAYQMCIECHEDNRARFNLPSHHPVAEGKVLCTDCHSPHGTPNDHLLRKKTVKATCTRCHPEKEGPFVYGHAGATEDCSACHEPHGSVNDNLLTVSEPYLCLQCHESGAGHFPGSREGRAAFYTRCTDCHSQVHGSDVPGLGGGGSFTR